MILEESFRVLIKIFAVTITSVFFLILGTTSTSAANVNFNITANSGGVGSNQGNFSPNSVAVNAGDNVTITFSVPGGDPYCCGAQVKGNGGQFDTGTINKGGSQTINFTASSSFTFTSYWPETGTPKATGNVVVNQPTPVPPSTPAGLTATPLSTTQIDLEWDAALNATAYEVYRDGILVNSTSMLFYHDSGLTANTTYSYKLKSVNSDAKSGFSNIVSAKTLQASASTPTPTNTPTTGVTGTPSVSTTVTPSTSVTGTPTPTPTGTQNPVNIFVDTVYDYAGVNDNIFGFLNLPVINQGDSFKIWGRTVAGASITIIVQSSPVSYSTTANQDGYWSVEIDTSTLEPGEHTFQTEITTKDVQGKLTREAVKFSVSQSEVTPTPSVTGAGQQISQRESLSEQLRDYYYVFMISGTTLILLSLLIWLKKH